MSTKSKSRPAVRLVGSNGRKVYALQKQPDPATEDVVSYYPEFGDLCERKFGVRPSRYSCYKYLKRGFPARRGGPYIQMPVFEQRFRVMTTTQALARFSALFDAIDAKLRA